MEAIWALSPSEAISPAGSSPAVLMRIPELNRVIESCRLDPLIEAFRWAIMPGILVLIRNDI